MAEFLGEVLPSSSSGLLESRSGCCENMFDGSGLPRHIPLRQIRANSEEDYQMLEEQLQEVAGRYVRSIVRQNFPASRRFVSDVITVGGPEENRRLRRWLTGCGSTYPGGFFLWVDEGNHYHVAHDCPWSNGSCRCKWKQEAVSSFL